MLIYLAYLGEADEHCHEPIGRRWKEVNITHCPGLELGRVEITFLSSFVKYRYFCMAWIHTRMTKIFVFQLKIFTMNANHGTGLICGF